MIGNNRSLCSPNPEGQKSEMSLTGLQAGCQQGCALERGALFSSGDCGCALTHGHAAAALPCGHIAASYLPSPLRQTSLCLPRIRIYAVAFRVRADDPGWSPHAKVLNHICKPPFWSCEAKGHVRWHSQAPGIRMKVSFSGACFSLYSPQTLHPTTKKKQHSSDSACSEGSLARPLSRLMGWGVEYLFNISFNHILIFQLLPLAWLSRRPQRWPFF